MTGYLLEYVLGMCYPLSLSPSLSHSRPLSTQSSCKGGPREKVEDDVLEERQIVFEELWHLSSVTLGDASGLSQWRSTTNNVTRLEKGVSTKVHESMNELMV